MTFIRTKDQPEKEEPNMMPRLIKRMDSIRDCTVEDAINWCIERDLSPRAVTITACHLKFETPETSAERERRDKWEVEHAERLEQWERQQLARLKVKYREDPETLETS